MTGAPEPLGLLPVDKPVGPTSHDIVNRARRALGTRRIGHTGTLDPFASGLLLLCVGPATRLAEYLDPLWKSYEATAILGCRTTTDDRLGDPVFQSEKWSELDPADLAAALAAFHGTIRQVPPAFSAKKIEGEAMYHRARRGEAVELPPVEVRVDEIELIEVQLPLFRFRVRCSTGTYIRAIARDLGEALGVGAHLSELRRTAIGAFQVERAVPAEALDDEAKVRESWIAPLEALAHLPAVAVGEDEVRALIQGRPLLGIEPVLEGPVAILHRQDVVAVGFFRDGRLHPRKVFARA